MPRSPAVHRRLSDRDVRGGLAPLPTANRHHGKTPPRQPDRESASNAIDDATSMPSTDIGTSAADHTASPRSRTTACM
jgi:hypothetical protein